MVGGVLVERTVKEVLPALAQNKDKLTKAVETLNANLLSKGKELNDYREKHNITVRGENQQPTGDNSNTKANQAAGVLVSNSK